MSSPRQPTTMENLPSDVLTNILIRLLAKQLAQTRCVSKSWNALLSESFFVKSHLHRSIHDTDEIFLFFPYDFSVDRSPFTLRFSGSSHFELTNFIQPLVRSHSVNTFGCVIGSVDGLICFHCRSDHNYVVSIWNPSLSAVLTLPPYSFRSRHIHFGFGYDPKTDDYKVVKLTRHFRPSRMSPNVEVYSMRKGSWELLTQTFPSHVLRIFDHHEFCRNGHDGHIYWLGHTGSEWKLQKTMVAFDLGAQTFREIPLPDSVLDYRDGLFVGVLDGKLCVISRVKDGKCEVWVMNEYGVAESWINHHVFSQFGCNIIPYGFTYRNEFLFVVDYDHFALYDPTTENVKTFKIKDRPYVISKVVKYIDSLVWTDGQKGYKK